MLFSGLIMANRLRRDDMMRCLGVLAEVIHLVQDEYVEELDIATLEQSLDAGIVQSVDPWAAVIPGELVDSYKELLQSTPAYGLGVGSRFSATAVRFALHGSPAAAAELQSWEVLEKIDGINTRGRPLWQVRLDLAEKQRRQETVQLTVIDRYGNEQREVTLEPTLWQPRPFVVSERDGIPVVTIECLPADAAANLERDLTGLDRVIVDLRGLVWGDEEEAVNVIDLFAEEGVLGQWHGQRTGDHTYTSTRPRVVNEPPLVLVSRNTEGVGEIVAAGLQRAGATVLGSATAGHAPHMSLIHTGELHLHIPVASWLRGDAEPISRNGVTPDEEIAAAAAEQEQDPVLDRALELARTSHD